MEITQHVDAPGELVRLIKTHYKTITTIDRVLIIGGVPLGTIPLLEGKLGVFVPGTRTVILDMKACMENQQWMDKGMTFIANIWCNLIYTILHEGAHGRQFMDKKMAAWDEATWEAQRVTLDHDADVEAMEQMIEWFGTGKNVPSLRGLGWVGQQLKILFNNLYSKAPDLINLETEVWGAGMVVEAAAQSPALKGDIEMLNLPQAYKDTHEIVRLHDAIDTGNVGMIINGRRCLRVGEALELSANKDRP